MKQLTLYIMGMVALVAMLTACSSEDVILDEPNAKNEITFNVTTNRASRAHEMYSNSHLPGFFNFSAWVRDKDDDVTSTSNGKMYVEHDDVFFNDQTNHWENQSGLRYWPNGGTAELLDFYAYVHGVSTPYNNKKEYVTNGSAFKYGTKNGALDPQLSSVQIQAEVADQVDILYDTKYAQKSESPAVDANTKVEFNFKHALTQVVFAAQKMSDKIHVEIEDITLVGTAEKGTFHFPRTNSEFAYWTGNSGATLESHASVKYKKEGETEESPVEVTQKPTGLTCKVIEQKDGTFTYEWNDNLAMLLIPNNYTKGAYSATEKKWNGAYIKVKCIIWNVAIPLDGVDKESDVVLWGVKDGNTYKAEAEWLYIPIEISWEGTKDENGNYTSCGGMNHRYIYTLKFGKGNAGQTANGERVIDAVSYSVKVDDWSNSSFSDVTEPGAEREG